MAKKFNPVTEVQLEAPNDRAPHSPEKQAEMDAAAAEIIQRSRDKLLSVENRKVDWRNKIAAAADAKRNMSMEEVLLGNVQHDEQTSRNQIGVFETYNEFDETEVEQNNVEFEEENIPTNDQTKITKIIGGKEVTRTIDEWLEIATKVEDADNYYAESVRRMHQKPEVPQVDEKEEIRNLARKLQLGSEAEAEEAVEALVNRAANKANYAKSQEDIQKAGEAIYMTFVRDYQDVMNDPVANAALISMEQKLIDQGKVFDNDPIANFDKRLRYVGDEVREWKKNLADVSVKYEKRQDLINKKQQIVNLNTANQKQTSREEKPLSEREGRDQAVQQMFQSRKKKAF